MHPSDCSCAPILQFFDVALDGSTTANRQIPDRIFGQLFTSLKKDTVDNNFMHRFGRCFRWLLEEWMCFTKL